jgi:hypothetical protein
VALNVIPLIPVAIAASRAVGLPTDQLYGVDPTSNAAGVRWEYGGSWEDWLCFDMVVEPVRVAAFNLSNNEAEVYAVTRAGKLFERRTYPHPIFWTSWAPLGLPYAASHLTDVSAVPGRFPYLYVADRGTVYARHRLTEDPYATMSGWQGLARNGAVAVAAEGTLDGVQQIVVVTENGALQTAVQREPLLGARFGAWATLESPAGRLVDAEIGRTANGELLLFVVDDEGGVWERGLSPWGSEWLSIGPDLAPASITTIAVRSVPAFGPHVFGLDDGGVTYAWSGAPGIWSALP